jgi:hypothetical protein
MNAEGNGKPLLNSKFYLANPLQDHQESKQTQRTTTTTTTTGEVHNKLTRYRKCLHIPQVNLLPYQKGVYYMSIKVFDGLLHWIANLVQNKKIFISKLKSALMEQSLYSANDFPDYCVMH